MTRLSRSAAYLLVLVLTVELAVWGAFLTGTRPFGLALPVSALVAAVGNLGLGIAGARVLGRPLGAVVPGVVWIAIALVLGSRTSEGDLVVSSSGRGLSFLIVGAVAATIPIGLATSATPRGHDGR